MSESVTAFTDETEECKKSGFVIVKPHYLAKKCALRATSQRLPEVDKLPKIKGTPTTNVSKNKLQSHGAELESWMKESYHLSLPKLTSLKRRRPDAGEPYGPNLPKALFCFEKTPLTHGKHTQRPLALISDPEIVESFQGEDNASETSVAGPSQCHRVFRVPSAELQLDETNVTESKVEEHDALKNWNVWCKRLKSIQETIKKKTGRNECDMVLNSLYEHRKTCETKDFCTYLNKQKEERKLRKIPEYPKSGDKKKKKKDQADFPVEFIDLPIPSKIERNLLSEEKKHVGTLTKTTKIRKCNMKEIKVPKPEMDKLAVVGQAINLRSASKQEQVESVDVPKIYVQLSPDDESNDTTGRASIFSLTINGREVTYEVNVNIEREPLDDDSLRTWEVQFGLKEVGNLYENTVVVENRGTIAVSYEWVKRKPVQRQSLNSLQPSHYEPWFFFNKNPGIFVPGQKYRLNFFLHPNKSGVRTEIWYLKTYPSIFPNDRCAKFILTCVATGDNPQAELDVIENYLTRREAQSAVRIILDNLIGDLVRPDFGLNPIEYRSLLSEKDIFESHNSKHYYKSNLVEELKEMFHEVICRRQDEWDLSFSTLVNVIRTCVAEKDKKERFLRRTSEIAKQLLKPVCVKTKSNKKYNQVYQVLCGMVNHMEADYERLGETEGGEKNTSECGETVSTTSSNVTQLETNRISFYLIIYIKVYNRICQAVEQVAGIIETHRNLSRW